jgi:hypothetical protein
MAGHRIYTVEQVQTVRRLVASKALPKKTISGMTGVSEDMVRLIANRQVYKDVPDGD